MDISSNYLKDIPQDVEKYGFSKVLLVRKEVIHIKHIMTEIFIRRKINIDDYLNSIDYSLFDYIRYLTNRIRKIHNINRNYSFNLNRINKISRNDFFPYHDILNQNNTCPIVLDFDGVVTDKRFEKLYRLCLERSKVIICSANPTITEDYFLKRNLPLPYKIYSMKGRKKKLFKLLDIQTKYNFIQYIDDEKKYLEFAFLFGIHTYHWTGKQIKYFTLKTK